MAAPERQPRETNLPRSEDDFRRGQALAERRAELGLSQAEAAQALGTTQQTVARWERGQRPQPRFRRRLEEFLTPTSDAGRLIPFPTQSPSVATSLPSPVQQVLIDGLARRLSDGVPLAVFEVEAFRNAFRHAGLAWE